MNIFNYRINFVLILLIIGANLSAQSGYINYQGAVRNSNTGNALTNKNISLLISLKDGSANGSIIYSEKQNVTTSDVGIFNIRIGEGQAVTGNYQNLTWAGNNRWLQVEMDSEGGSNYNVIGVSELVSVPYALSAKTLANPLNLTQLGDVGNISPTAGQVLQWNGSQWTPATVTGGGGSQSLFLSGDNLSISNGNSVTLPDGSATNEIQTLSLSGANLSLSNGGGSVALPTGTTYTAGNGINISGNSISNAGDLSNTNEIQTMTLAGNNLALSNGGGSVTLPTGATYTAGTGINIAGNSISNAGDLSNTNEIQTMTLAGNNLSLSNGGGSVALPTGITYTAGTGIDISGNAISNSGDISNTNELQTISKNGDMVQLSGGGGSVDVSLTVPVIKVLNDPNYLMYLKNTGQGNTLIVEGISNLFSPLNVSNLGLSSAMSVYNTGGGYSVETHARMGLFGLNDLGSSAGIEYHSTAGKAGFFGISAGSELGMWGYGLNTWIMRFNTSTGQICANQAIAICSDKRLKKDFSRLNSSLSAISLLNGYNYHMINEKIPGLQTGFIAQEVQEVFPELVKTDDEGMLSVDYIGMIPHLVESIKTLNDLVKKQEQRIQVLEKMMAQQ
jgi:hypothetical protein